MQPSIYERIGGSVSNQPAVDLFYEKVWVYEKVCADPALACYLDRIDRTRLKAHQRAFMTSTLGVPERGMSETPAVFHQVVAHLTSTLTELGVDEDTVGQIAGALAPLRTDLTAVTR